MRPTLDAEMPTSAAVVRVLRRRVPGARLPALPIHLFDHDRRNGGLGAPARTIHQAAEPQPLEPLRPLVDGGRRGAHRERHIGLFHPLSAQQHDTCPQTVARRRRARAQAPIEFRLFFRRDLKRRYGPCQRRFPLTYALHKEA